ncbi:MAG TPA: LysR substrate-binding domain-containing protein [Rhizomicrobium sp.]|nr:LysR substrate-binding domain-containing protein [Rhizomicrobium sp.]
MRRLPPLTALRAFEATGRLENVKSAAEELNVTPAAITHQIRQLEEHLRVDLFSRSSKGMTLTRGGREFFLAVSQAFELLHESARKVECEGRTTLTVSSLPSFASCWLVPRLPRFYAANPGIELEINTVGNSGQQVDFAKLGADIAIRVGLNESAWPGLTVEKLVHEKMFPACAPRLLKGPNGLHHPRDLAKHHLLQVSRRPEGWPEWFAEAERLYGSLPPIDPTQGPRFDTIQMATSAAVEGMGVVIGRTPLIDDYIESGALIAPFDLKVHSKAAYWLVRAKGDSSRPITLFSAWLRRELGLSPQAVPAAT